MICRMQVISNFSRSCMYNLSCGLLVIFHVRIRIFYVYLYVYNCIEVHVYRCTRIGQIFVLGVIMEFLRECIYYCEFAYRRYLWIFYVFEMLTLRVIKDFLRSPVCIYIWWCIYRGQVCLCLCELWAYILVWYVYG